MDATVTVASIFYVVRYVTVRRSVVSHFRRVVCCRTVDVADNCPMVPTWVGVVVVEARVLSPGEGREARGGEGICPQEMMHRAVSSSVAPRRYLPSYKDRDNR